MGTVPTPARPLSGVALQQIAHTDTWCDVMAFLLRPPSCRVFVAASTPFTSGNVTWTGESWDVVQVGDTEMHSLVTNPGAVTIRTAGRYQISGTLTMRATTAALVVSVVISKGATGIYNSPVTIPTGNYTQGTYVHEEYFAIGDAITMQLYYTGSGLVLQGDLLVDMVVTWVSN